MNREVWGESNVRLGVSGRDVYRLRLEGWEEAAEHWASSGSSLEGHSGDVYS